MLVPLDEILLVIVKREKMLNFVPFSPTTKRIGPFFYRKHDFLALPALHCRFGMNIQQCPGMSYEYSARCWTRIFLALFRCLYAYVDTHTHRYEFTQRLAIDSFLQSTETSPIIQRIEQQEISKPKLRHS